MGFFLFIIYRHAHYQTGNTPLALVWKDETCSEYVIDTDNKGQIPNQQQVVTISYPLNQHASFQYVAIFF